LQALALQQASASENPTINESRRFDLLTGRMTKERGANFPEDDCRKRAYNYQEPLLSRNLAWADFLRIVGARHDLPAGVIAIAWTLHNPGITAAIVGRRNAEQVDGVAPALSFSLSDAEYKEMTDCIESDP
jgi:aryl-alcohol dehydrogenase-like predicted oxidoreductase